MNTGPVFLGLAVVFSSGVALTLKAADQPEIHSGQLLALNYLVCTVTVLAWGGWSTLAANTPLLWALSGLIGAFYVLSLWLFHRAIAAEGVALSTTLMRLSAALPTLGSLVLFSEPAAPVKLAGIALAFLALPLASRKPLRLATLGDETARGMLWGLLLFAVYGITDFIFKIQVELAPHADPKAFMTGIFGTALLLTLPRLWSGPRLTRKGMLAGLVLGSTNMLATYFWILALALIPGSAAYPTLALGVIAVSTLAGLIFWSETLRPANYLFLALSSLAVVLIHSG